jgi:FixJ family two-component response regulator
MDNKQFVSIVDDDEGIREGLCLLLESVGQPCKLYSDAHQFLNDHNPKSGGCLILDIRMPQMTGLELQQKLNEQGSTLPIIFITGHGDIPMAVEAMRRGALDFIRKPFREQDLLDRVNEALEVNAGRRQNEQNQQAIMDKLDSLSGREQQVFQRVAAGEMNKVIAQELNISERTVEVHRSQVMKKLQVRTLAHLVRIKLESERANVG